MNLYEIVCTEEGELEGKVFGHFTTEELANEALKALPKEFSEISSVRKSQLQVNTIVTNNVEIDFTKTKSRKELLASRDERGYITAYVQVDLSDLIEWDIEELDDFVSETLTGSWTLSDINFEIVGFHNGKSVILKVTADASWCDDD